MRAGRWRGGQGGRGTGRQRRPSDGSRSAARTHYRATCGGARLIRKRTLATPVVRMGPWTPLEGPLHKPRPGKTGGGQARPEPSRNCPGPSRTKCSVAGPRQPAGPQGLAPTCACAAQTRRWSSCTGGGANSERGDPTGRLGNWVGACCRLTAQPHRTKGQEPRPLERGRNVLGKTSIGRHLIRPGATRHRSGLRPKGGPPRVVHNQSIFVGAFKNTTINCIHFVTCM